MRTSGILLHISSLPSPYGIGTLGREAYRFVDFLRKSGQTYWQTLPIGITSYGDSPYQSFSSFAGNPYFIDLDLLCSDGYLEKDELSEIDFGDDPGNVDFGRLYKNRYGILEKAFEKFKSKPEAQYSAFCEKNAAWLEDFVLFMAIKDENGGASWQEWEAPLKSREASAVAAAKARLADRMEFYRVIEYLFFKQWFALKEYANENGVKMIGDIPIYVSLDSADVWASPEYFKLDKSLAPTSVAGCPPDDFAEDGQRWGNPLYNWKSMKNDGYSWWCRRVAFSSRIFDVMRIDHFRGFEAYWSIPAADKTAKGGKWVKGPGYSLFAALEKELGELPIIAEDLGFLTEGVKNLLKKTGFPGMKVLEFAFDTESDSEYLPHNICKNSVAYIGTHDNEPAMLWLESAPEKSVEFAKKYMRLTKDEGYNWGFVRTLLSCPADTVIIQMQDLIGLGKGARMNTPSVTGGNWRWRVRGECINDWLAGIIRKETSTYRRLPETDRCEKLTDEK